MTRREAAEYVFYSIVGAVIAAVLAYFLWLTVGR